MSSTSETPLLERPIRRAVDEAWLRGTRQRLGLSDLRDRVVDVTLILREFQRHRHRRALLLEILLHAVLLGLLIAAAAPSWRSSGFWLTGSVRESLAYDPFSVLSLSLIPSNIMGSTTLPQAQQSSERLPRVLENCTAADNACLLDTARRTFLTIRRWADFEEWMSKSLLTSPFLVGENSTGSSQEAGAILVGAVRVRQLRSAPCDVSSETINTELTRDYLTRQAADGANNGLTNTSACFQPISKSSLETRDIPMSSEVPPSLSPSFVYSPPNEADAYENPLSEGGSPLLGKPTYSVYSDLMGIRYPSGGYLWTVPRCRPDLAAAEWASLRRADWIDEKGATAAVFVSFTYYDPPSDSLVFTLLSSEFYPNGPTMRSSADVRVFRIPGSASDSTARGSTYALAGVSLIFLFWYLYKAFRAPEYFEQTTFWLFIDFAAVVTIQAAVWVYVAWVDTEEARVLGNPQAINQASSCSYADYISTFDYASYSLRAQAFVYGAALVLTGLKLFKLCELSTLFSLPIVVAQETWRELWSFILLALCVTLFFAVGAAYFYGGYLGEFYTLGSAMMTVILMSSLTSTQDESWLQASPFPGDRYGESGYSAMEEPSSVFGTLQDRVTLMSRYTTSPMFSLALWYVLLCLVAYWIMRNLMIGIVVGGTARTREEIQSEAHETQATATALDSNEKGRTSSSRVRSLIFKRGLIHYLSTCDALVNRLASDKDLSSRGLVGVAELEHVLEEIFWTSADRNKEEYLRAFMAHLVADFGVQLTYVDEALLLLRPHMKPFESAPRDPPTPLTEREEDDAFDPVARARWRRAVESGAVLQSVAFCSLLETRVVSRELSRVVSRLDDKQRELSAYLASSGVKNALHGPTSNVGKLHGIVSPTTSAGLYRVHHVSRLQRVYRFIGTYKTMNEAEAAFSEADELINAAEEEDARHRRRAPGKPAPDEIVTLEDDDDESVRGGAGVSWTPPLEQDYDEDVEEMKQQKLALARRHAKQRGDVLVPTAPLNSSVATPMEKDEKNALPSRMEEFEELPPEEKERRTLKKRCSRSCRVGCGRLAACLRSAFCVSASTSLNGEALAVLHLNSKGVWLNSSNANFPEHLKRPRAVPPLAYDRYARLVAESQAKSRLQARRERAMNEGES